MLIAGKVMVVKVSFREIETILCEDENRVELDDHAEIGRLIVSQVRKKIAVEKGDKLVLLFEP